MVLRNCERIFYFPPRCRNQLVKGIKMAKSSVYLYLYLYVPVSAKKYYRNMQICITPAEMQKATSTASTLVLFFPPQLC